MLDKVRRPNDHDPTGTANIRLAFYDDLRERWNRLNKVLSKGIGVNDMLGLGPHSPVIAGPSADRVLQFRKWLDELLVHLILGGDGSWMQVYLWEADNRAVERAEGLTASYVRPVGEGGNPIQDVGEWIGSIDVRDAEATIMYSLAVSELQGICDAVSQQASRIVAHAILTRLKPAVTVRALRAVLSTVALVRSKAMVAYLVVKAFSHSTLAAFRAAGVTHIGIVPESLRIVPPAEENFGGGARYDVHSPTSAKPRAAAPIQLHDIVVDEVGDVLVRGRRVDNIELSRILADSYIHDYDPNEPRNKQGEWTTEGSVSLEQKLQNAEQAMLSISATDKINTPERNQLREKLVNELYNKDIEARKHNRQVTIVLGLPASGKSTISRPLVEKGALEIDPDLVKEKLPEYNNGLGAHALHEESSAITRKILQNGISHGDDLVWPRINSPDKIVADIQSFKKAGYDVHMQLLQIDPKEAIKSSISRFEKTGRYVAPKVIEGYGDSPQKAYQAALSTGLVSSHVMYKRDKGGISKVE